MASSSGENLEELETAPTVGGSRTLISEMAFSLASVTSDMGVGASIASLHGVTVGNLGKGNCRNVVSTAGAAALALAWLEAGTSRADGVVEKVVRGGEVFRVLMCTRGVGGTQVVIGQIGG